MHIFFLIILEDILRLSIYKIENLKELNIMSDKILIVSTHMDDEILSCASFLEKNLDKITIFYHNDEHPLVDNDILRKENKKLISFLKCNVILSVIRAENKMDTVPLNDLINEYENIIYDYAVFDKEGEYSFYICNKEEK